MGVVQLDGGTDSRLMMKPSNTTHQRFIISMYLLSEGGQVVVFPPGQRRVFQPSQSGTPPLNHSHVILVFFFCVDADGAADAS